MPRLPRKVAASPATNPVQAGHQSQPSALRVPPLPRKTKVDVTKCRACLAKRRWTSPSATPATQSPATNRPSAPPEPAQCPKCHACHAKRKWLLRSATHATQNEGRCNEMLRLQGKTKVDVAKCHACHAKCGGVTGDLSSPSAPPAQCPKCHTCHAKLKVDVTKKFHEVPRLPGERRRMCHQAPHLPPETAADVAKCHACHVKRKWMSRRAHLLNKTKVDVAKCQACHAKCGGVTGD